MSISQRKFGALSVALLGATLAAAPAVFAQQDAPLPPPAQGDMQDGGHHGGHGRGMMDPRHRLEFLTHELNLSPEQQTALKGVFADERAQWEQQRSQSQQMSEQDRHAAMRAAHEQEKTKIEAILTADQKTKYEAMEARMRERMMEHRDGGNPPPPPQ